MLLTEYPPSFGGGGAVILHSLLTPEDQERLVWLTLSSRAAPAEREVGLRVLTFPRGVGWPRRSSRSVWADSTLLARRLGDQVLELARKHRVRGLWSVLHNAIVPITAHVTRSGQLPVHGTVHDDPAFATALRSRRYPLLVPWLEHELGVALRGCQSVDVISEGMARRYRDRFGVSSVVVHRAMRAAIDPSPRYDRARGLRVAVLGNTYGNEQLRVLSEAVALAADEVGVQGGISIIGGGSGAPLGDFRTRIAVEALGHLEETRAVELLRTCFIQYLNYPFGLRDRVLRETSFPTKLSTYLQSARPLLLHMPPGSSALPVMRFSPLGVGWQSMDAREGARALSAAWRNERMLDSLHGAADEVRRAYYDGAKHQLTLATALAGLGA